MHFSKWYIADISYYDRLPYRLPPVVPSKLVLQLRLDPISRVPVILKDVVQPPAGPKMIDLVAGEYDGPPGKVFSLNVLQHVQAGGPAARVVADEDCSGEQRLWFSKLLDELEKGSLVRLFLPNQLIDILTGRQLPVHHCHEWAFICSLFLESSRCSAQTWSSELAGGTLKYCGDAAYYDYGQHGIRQLCNCSGRPQSPIVDNSLR